MNHAGAADNRDMKPAEATPTETPTTPVEETAQERYQRLVELTRMKLRQDLDESAGVGMLRAWLIDPDEGPLH